MASSNQGILVKESEVLKILQGIQDPDLKKDIVTLGFIKDLTIQGGKVSFKIELTTPACPVRDQLYAEAKKAVASLAGVESVEVTMGFSVSSRLTPHASTLIPGVKNTIAVASGKGGVGKSTLAANLAVGLKSFGAAVGLMDADVYGPSIPILMGASEPPQVMGSRIIPPVSQGVKMISMGYFLPKDEAVIWRGPMLHKMVHQFLGEVEWGTLDYLVIDLPPGTGDIQLSLCQTIPLTGAVIVSTPQDLALEVASKAIAMFKRLKTPILGIVENMSYFVCPHCGQREEIFGYGGARAASQAMHLPFLGEIPLNSAIRKRSDSGQPLTMDEEMTPLSEVFRAVASATAAQVSIVNHLTPVGPVIEES
ncbi:MAG: Mrp/NBP35 family ATP-binding protein [Terriglobia bacterium]